MLLAGMNSVTALNTTLRAIHENKQLDYATPAPSVLLTLHISLNDSLSMLIQVQP